VPACVDNAAVIDSIFIGSTTSAVSEALQAAGAPRGPVAVIGPLRLGRALAERGYEIVQIVERERSRGGGIARQVQATPASLPLADGELAALVAGGAGRGDDWQALLAEWSRVVMDRGVIVLVDRARAQPTEMARRALCSGLTEIEQRRAGRKIVTSGCVARL
jgi:hypothetical protein